MSKRKEPLDAAALLARAQEIEAQTRELWGLGMRQLPINSAEYRAICAAGKAAHRLAVKLWVLAGEPGSPTRDGSGCTYN